MNQRDSLLKAFEAFAHADTEAFEGYIPTLKESNAPLAKLLLGMYFFNHADASQAEETLKECLDLDGQNFQAHFNLALLLINQHRVDEAIEHYGRAYDINNAHFSLLYNYGLSLHEKARSDDDVEVLRSALKRYFEALEINPEFTSLRVNTRDALKESETPEEELGQFDAARSTEEIQAFSRQVLGEA